MNFVLPCSTASALRRPTKSALGLWVGFIRRLLGSGHLALGLFALALACTTNAADRPSTDVVATIAVASNFAAPGQILADDFRRVTGRSVRLVLGSTGHLYAQIRHGAPHDALLSADAQTPERLVQEKLAVPGTAFTYAQGRLVLWSASATAIDPEGRALREGRIDRLAIASPTLAPYGRAALEVLDRLQAQGVPRPKIVEAASIAQAYQFVASGNAVAGLVARSQVQAPPRGGASESLPTISGSGWLVPASLHKPIQQDAVLLRHGKANATAVAFLEYLQSPRAQSVIADFGYDAAR